MIKNKNIIKNLFLGCMVSTAMLSCNIEDDNDTLTSFEPGVVENPVTISQLLIERPDLSILEEAIRIVQDETDFKLLTDLNVPGSSTLLAPSNEAFQRLLDANELESIGDLNPNEIADLLLNHVLTGEFSSADLTTGFVETSAFREFPRFIPGAIVPSGLESFNLSAYVNADNGVTINGEANVVTPDIDANNGVIHIIDEIINAPSLLDLIEVNPEFSSFVEALAIVDAQESAPDLGGRLNDGNFRSTVFLPNNAAFAALLLELDPSGATALSDIDPVELERILRIHILTNGIAFSENFVDREIDGLIYRTLLDEDEAFIGINTTTFTITDDRDRVIAIDRAFVDIISENGLIHVVDRVILPPVVEVTMEEEVVE
jgi:uncharacterized surface protein with fasciclin (FAS1) repeats